MAHRPQRRRRRPIRALLVVVAVAGAVIIAVVVADANGGGHPKAPAATSSTPSAALPAPTSLSTPATTASSSTASTAGATTTAAVATTDAAATLTDCQGDSPEARPASLTLACGDGGITMSGVSWSAWGGPEASGTGTLSENNCQPNCAQGSFVSEPATITASDLVGGQYGALSVTPSPPNTQSFTPISSTLPT